LIWEARRPRESYVAARAAYVQAHNLEQRAKRLLEILAVA
jgi:hypothetical protein